MILALAIAAGCIAVPVAICLFCGPPENSTRILNPLIEQARQQRTYGDHPLIPTIQSPFHGGDFDRA
jgi:hypothetical protein